MTPTDHFLSRRDLLKTAAVVTASSGLASLAWAEDVPPEPDNLDEPTPWQEGDPQPTEAQIPPTEPEQTSSEAPPSRGSSFSPSVLPGCRTLIADTVQPSSSKISSSTCSTLNSAASPSSGTGKTTGFICSRRIDSSEMSPCLAPQIRTRLPSANSGAKNGNPWMWSQCVWLTTRSTSTGSADLASSLPRFRIPVPASKMMTRPESASGKSTETHGVLPPYRAVAGPGVGIEPRAPQIVARSVISPCSRARIESYCPAASSCNA